MARITDIMRTPGLQRVTLARNQPALPVRWLRVLSFVALAAGWEWLAYRLHSLLLPSFTATAAALARLVTTRALWQAVWISNHALVLGFSLACLVGVPLGLLLGRWRAIEPYVDPYLSIVLVTPRSTLIPIVIMATGLGLTSRLLVVFSYAVVVITVNVRAGMRTILPSWVEMAHSFGASEWQLWRRILLPGAFPAVLTGLRMGLTRAVSGMVSVELLLMAVGLGRLVLYYRGTFDSASLYAVSFIIILEALLLSEGAGWLERRFAPWRPEAASS